MNTMLMSIYVFHNRIHHRISNTIFHVEESPHHFTIPKTHTYMDISNTDVANKFAKQGVQLCIIEHLSFHLIGNSTPYWHEGCITWTQHTGFIHNLKRTIEQEYIDNINCKTICSFLHVDKWIINEDIYHSWSNLFRDFPSTTKTIFSSSSTYTGNACKYTILQNFPSPLCIYNTYTQMMCCSISSHVAPTNTLPTSKLIATTKPSTFLPHS